MKRLLTCLSLLLWSPFALADGEQPEDFDYYVLALSWSPNWCAADPDRQDAEQCQAEKNFGFSLHGLWPQYDRGFPSFCSTLERAPSRAMTASMADIMGSSGLAWHQWKKHGRCTGLSAENYYRLSRLAFDQVTRPEIFRKLDKTYALPAAVIEEAFLEANPDFHKDGVTVTCKGRDIQEVRICLTRDLDPRKCNGKVRRDCTLKDALMNPIPGHN